MRIATILAATLLCLTQAAEARRPVAAKAAPTTLADRIDAIAPGDVLVAGAAEFDASMGRTSIDVRFGPADSVSAGRATWLADGLGRDGSMRRAGIHRLVLLRDAATVRLTAEPALIMASR